MSSSITLNPITSCHSSMATSERTINEEILEGLKLHNFSTSQKKLERMVSEIDPNQLSDIIKAFSSEVVQSTLEEDPLKAFERLIKLIPLKKIEAVLKEDFEGFVDTLTTAKQMVYQAEHYLDTVEKEKINKTLHFKIKGIIRSVLNAIDVVLTSFGMKDFFKDPETGGIKVQKLMMTISFLSTITAILVPLFAASVSVGLIIVGCVLGLIGLSVAYSLFLKPIPNRLPYALNLTKKVEEGGKSFVDGRKKYLDQIADLCSVSKKGKAYPLLFGPKGVGKTETVKAFAHGIARGDYPQLAGKKVFYVDTGDIVKEKEALKKISRAMGKHRDKIILVFDNLEKLESMVDIKEEKFPHIIGILSSEAPTQFERTSLARRFQKIEFENPSEEEAIEILNNYVIRNYPQTFVEDGAMKFLYEITNKNFPDDGQPGASIDLLSQCLRTMTAPQETPLQRKVNIIQENIEALTSQEAVRHGISLLYHTVDHNNEITRLKEELKGLKLVLEKEKKEIKTLGKIQEKLIEAKERVLRTAVKLNQVNTMNDCSINESHLRAFLLISHFLIPKMAESIVKRAEEKEIKVVLNENLIQDVVRLERIRRQEVN